MDYLHYVIDTALTFCQKILTSTGKKFLPFISGIELEILQKCGICLYSLRSLSVTKKLRLIGVFENVFGRINEVY
ncbi:hypothetical Protein YC6258_05691 [Gynuella sunshinyii YC6258]|uniref:Uncharacterized protein n=1 Tax=Gynuella sunshinyii YC6258 TaxID=1445510 RepID=A0A0C5W546_9GAMM|nr:hypothetical Protein YC6258_05691 [Gynuella sunshinyii YC6258]